MEDGPTTCVLGVSPMRPRSVSGRVFRRGHGRDDRATDRVAKPLSLRGASRTRKLLSKQVCLLLGQRG